MLVLRYQFKGKTVTRVWRGHSYYHVLKSAYAAATRAYTGRAQRQKPWGKRQDDILKENYNVLSKSQLAALLTKKFKRKYTKNMVISRWHGIKQRESK